jgi:hypothetical protein
MLAPIVRLTRAARTDSRRVQRVQNRVQNNEDACPDEDGVPNDTLAD